MRIHHPKPHAELPSDDTDPVLRALHWILRIAAYAMAIAMVLVILEGVVSVMRTVYLKLAQAPYFIIPDIIQTFGAFLAVLIAYEIFSNITLYIRTDVFPVKLVLATALMAIARKIIVLDMEKYSALDLIGIGAMVLGLGIAYWLISRADSGILSVQSDNTRETTDDT
ncbi:phosphate-starvation-inducible PsiE family protein [Thiorhodococcus mannitoliphagus]|uniref:Phosphate-starvation-inducible PsiE family protein n=1 Tax=Thiorhodococcus mannitoliphagus TaxID=329406 RepID=A0A6P1DM27_9GAMM|nr:phosphate-starvation-inducible PsiE family protein [Thiorhodococcus mannitoliphagus]NEX18969.1 phosphate-starvation-inducible PsiE family protein [Thiorhodococcus mannitoliphagus]